ncbi:uncharacterized protein LOC142235657 [Haematobia irritans]|uniref:uncharacterized protein LOC142235657 n=1 Tax=Haematobia irritans TaxID=7368 RepID=UPI003F4F876F
MIRTDPSTARNQLSGLKILRRNCNGLTRKVAEITDFMDKRGILISALQETKLSSRNGLTRSSCYSVIRQDRERNAGGGIAFIVHDSVRYRPMLLTRTDPHLVIQEKTVTVGKEDICILNVYIPPDSACQTGYKPMLRLHLNTERTILLGDLNAHHDSWYSEHGCDARGELIEDQVDDKDFCVLNEDRPNRITATCRSSPDVTMVSSDLVTQTSWHVDKAMNSDHLSMTVNIDFGTDTVIPEKRTFMNFGRANWELFTSLTEYEFATAPLQTSAPAGERSVRISPWRHQVHRASRKQRRVFRALKQDNPAMVIGQENVLRAIEAAKSSTAIGPDGLAMTMLKHIGENGVRYLTHTFNVCLSTLEIPDIWKIGKVVPVLKPGKQAHLGDSYRPITLLSPVTKILEAILLPYFTEHLMLAEHQHGFRSGRSTTTALCELTANIAEGLNSKRPHKRSILVALDLSKAFDTVNHTTLLGDIRGTSLPSNLKRWLANYMAGRQSYVEFRGKRSAPSSPQPPPDVHLIIYADDCSIVTTGRDIRELKVRINDYLPALRDFFVNRNLKLSAPKSTATIFTSCTKEVNLELDIHIRGQCPHMQEPQGSWCSSLIHMRK